jgi:hypothetical protein
MLIVPSAENRRRPSGWGMVLRSPGGELSGNDTSSGELSSLDNSSKSAFRLVFPASDHGPGLPPPQH